MLALTPMEGLAALFLTGIGIIAIGVFFEDGMNKKSVAANVGSILLIWLTTNLNLFVYPLLIFYVFIGIVVLKKKVKFLYGVFNSKTYGSLLFAIALMETPAIQTDFTSKPFSQIPTFSILFIFLFMLTFFWFTTSIFAYVIEKILKK